MRTAAFCAALAAALVPASVGAQALNLTESEALARLSTDSPRARAVRAGVDIARADMLTAARWPNPRMTVDREAVAGVTEYIVIVAQPLPITGRRGLDVRAASALLDASSRRADDELRRLRADLRLAFADLVAAETREHELMAARDRLRELADVLAKREAAGDAAGFDRLRAEREVLDIDTDRTVAATDRARAQAMLTSFFVGVQDPSRIRAVSRSTVPADLPPLDSLVEQAVSTRGELLALRQEIEAARLAERAAVRRRIPEPELVAGTKSSTADGGRVGTVITVQGTIPLFDRARPERALAVARAAQAEARADAFRLVLRGQIAALRAASWNAATQPSATARKRSTAPSKSSGIAQVSYEAGERGILELLDAYRTGSTARVRQVMLDAAVREAEIELEFASGW